MMRLTPILALSIGLGLSAPALAASQGNEQMEGSQGTSQSKMQQSQYKDPHRMMVIGEVVDMRGVQLKGPAGDEHRLLKLSAQDAQEDTIIVDLGAMTQQAFKDLGINQGNLVWALGSSARINGKPVLYARYVGELNDVQVEQSSSQEQGEFSSFEADNLATDDYGAYDEDFAWETDSDWYDEWYGPADDDSGGYYRDLWYTHPGEGAR